MRPALPLPVTQQKQEAEAVRRQRAIEAARYAKIRRALVASGTVAK